MAGAPRRGSLRSSGTRSSSPPPRRPECGWSMRHRRSTTYRGPGRPPRPGCLSACATLLPGISGWIRSSRFSHSRAPCAVRRSSSSSTTGEGSRSVTSTGVRSGSTEPATSSACASCRLVNGVSPPTEALHCGLLGSRVALLAGTLRVGGVIAPSGALGKHSPSSKEESMRVLVTGATGHVGRIVVERLVAAGVRVRAMTRRPQRGALPGGRRNRRR